MKFSTKLFLSILLLLAATFSLGGNLLMYASFSAARDRDTESAVASYQLVRYTAAAVGLNAGDVQITRVVSALRQIRLDEGAALRLRVDGGTAYCSAADEAQFQDLLGEYAAEDQLATEVFLDGGQHYLQVTGLLPLQNVQVELDGIFPIENAYAALHAQQHIYRRIFCVTLVLGALMALALIRLLTKPLKNLSATSQRIAGGDLSCRAGVEGDDEFAQLAADFNHMADELEAKIDALTDAMRRQEEFTGAFAHEMKTPMTSIIGYADILRSRELSEADRRRAANYIFTESRRLEKLSVKLLDLLVLRRRDFPLAPCELSRLVEETVRGMAPVFARQHIVLKGTVQPGARMAEADLLKTLLLNILDNARKAMPDGGEIRVAQRLTPDGFTIAVTDNGCGMPKAELAKITEAFYRVDKSRSRAQGGVGLGLAICNEIAALHGGTLRFDSIPGKGTRVLLTVSGQATGGEPA